MKFLKKIIPIVAGVMLGISTLGFAAADLSTWDQDFKSGAIIISSSADVGTQDIIAATDIAGVLGIESFIPGEEVEDKKLLEGGDTVYISQDAAAGAPFLDSITETLDDNDLTILEDGEFTDSVGVNDNDVEYTQFLEIDPNGIMGADYQADTEDADNTAGVYTKIADSDTVYTYTLNFKSPVKVDAAAPKADMLAVDLDMLGQSYTITDVKLNGAATQIDKIKMLTGVAELDIKDETALTATVDGTTYTITPDIYSDNSVKLTVEYGTTTEVSDKMDAGDTYKLKDDIRVGIKEVLHSDKESKTSSVSVYLGSREIELDDGGEVSIDGTDVDGSAVVITDSLAAGTFSLVSIAVSATHDGDDVFLAKGDDWDDPVFGAFSLLFDGLEEDTTKNIVDITTSSSSGKIEFENTNGDEIKLEFGFDNTAGDDVWLGDEPTAGAAQMDAESFLHDNEVLTSIGATDTTDHYFLVAKSLDAFGDGNAVHLFKIDKMTDADANGLIEEISIEDITGEVTEDVNIAEVAGAYTTTLFGDYDFEVNVLAAGPDTVQIDELPAIQGEVLVLGGFGVGEGIKLKDGAILWIDENLAAGGDDKVDITFFENNLDVCGPIIADIEYTLGDTEIQVKTVANPAPIVEDDDSKSQMEYSDWGAIVEYSTSNYDLTITSPEDQTEALIYVTTSVTTGGEVAQVYYTDDEPTTTFADMPVVSIGGTAINAVTAKLYGLPYPTYGTDATWTTETGVDEAGKGIIEIIESPEVGSIAMVVAGYEGADTGILGEILESWGDYDDIFAEGKLKALISTGGKTLVV